MGWRTVAAVERASLGRWEYDLVCVDLVERTIWIDGRLGPVVQGDYPYRQGTVVQIRIPPETRRALLERELLSSELAALLDELRTHYPRPEGWSAEAGPQWEAEWSASHSADHGAVLRWVTAAAKRAGSPFEERASSLAALLKAKAPAVAVVWDGLTDEGLLEGPNWEWAQRTPSHPETDRDSLRDLVDRIAQLRGPARAVAAAAGLL